jgi:cytochrome c biogenesis protein CcmG, thiol:disulfide interchange protein DsbE
MKKLLSALFILAALAVAAWFYKAYRTVPSFQAEENEFVNEQGAHVKIADLKGKYVLVNYFQTWCGSCIKELPSIDRLQNKIGKDKLAVMIVSDEDAAKIWDFRDRYCETLDYYRSDVSFDEINVLVYPTTYLLDPSGKVIFSKLEAFEWDSDEVIKLIR